MILLTGAAGKTGRAILRTLTDQGKIVKALVFHTDHLKEVEALGAKYVVVGDMRNSILVRKALQGVYSIYHICPNVHPDEIAIGQVIIDAAASVGIKHFVYHSVMHPQIEEMPHHWKKMRIEERLFESGLPYTILQPAVYMQNILVNLEKIVKTGKYIVPYDVQSRISMVDLDDVALAAAIVLTEVIENGNQSPHSGATYELVGTQPMSQTEVAAALGQQLGRPVLAESVAMDIWEREARASGLGEYQLMTLLKMFSYYGKYGFGGNTHVLSWLLNRPATSFNTFVKRETENRLHITQ